MRFGFGFAGELRMCIAERSELGAGLLELDRDACVLSKHRSGGDAERGHERDYGCAAGHDSNSGIDRRIGIVGGLLYDLPAEVDLGDAEREYECDGHQGSDTEPGHDGDGYERASNYWTDAGLSVDEPAGYICGRCGFS